MKVKKFGFVLLTMFIMAFAGINVFSAGFDLAGKGEGVILSSLPTPASPSLNQSRINAMIGLAGGAVPTDRTKDPAAWHAVTSNTLEWFDAISTSFPSWMGKSGAEVSGAFAQERGHRLIVSISGGYPVSKYWLRLVSNNPNIGGGFFAIGKNTADGKEIAFNQNFVGISFGANGKLDSAINSSGIWEQKGDDMVFATGQLPSAVTYDVWYRFGSSTSEIIDTPAGFDKFKMDLAFTAELVSREGIKDTTVVMKQVSIGKPKLLISQDEGVVQLTISDGRPGGFYDVLGSIRAEGPYVAVNSSTSGRSWNIYPTASSPVSFFFLKSRE